MRDLEVHGFVIETGFLHEKHPSKSDNYFRSWQERFDTHDIDLALQRCRAAKDQFDRCWIRDDGGYTTLVTRVQIPAFKTLADGSRYLLFPRIALDPPSITNGWRRFPLGNGRELTDAQVDLLLNGFRVTREGFLYNAGDLLLVDNVRYGHSREAYHAASDRRIGVAMAGRIVADSDTN